MRTKVPTAWEDMGRGTTTLDGGLQLGGLGGADAFLGAQVGKAGTVEAGQPI